MRFSYAESMTDPSFYAAARPGRRGGRVRLDGGARQHLLSAALGSRYPFNPDGSREFLEDKPFLEPFSLIPALGAVTTRLRFVTFVIKLPVRNPVLVAKQATSVAVLTGNRLVLGVGTSPWREDYEVLGVPWGGRGPADGRGARHPPRAVRRRVLRVPRRGLRPRRRSRSPRCRPSRCRSSSAGTATPRCAAPPGWGTAGCTAGATPRTCPACSPGSAELRQRGGHRRAAVRGARDLPGRLQPRTGCGGWRTWG